MKTEKKALDLAISKSLMTFSYQISVYYRRQNIDYELRNEWKVIK